jgi:CheY-like chemotaxis protein
MNREASNGAVTVLVVEDEPFILDMVSEELTGEGFSVLKAKTGEVALSIIESGQMVDVLFTNIRLPGELDGWQLAATAREAKPEPPVIYTSGYAVEQGTAVPGSVFLKKPYLPSAMVAYSPVRSWVDCITNTYGSNFR